MSVSYLQLGTVGISTPVFVYYIRVTAKLGLMPRSMPGSIQTLESNDRTSIACDARKGNGDAVYDNEFESDAWYYYCNLFHSKNNMQQTLQRLSSMKASQETGTMIG